MDGQITHIFIFTVNLKCCQKSVLQIDWQGRGMVEWEQSREGEDFFRAPMVRGWGSPSNDIIDYS